jgi:hypothetical protein
VRGRLLYKSLAGTAACLGLGYYAFVRGTRVPLLGGADLGFHELGHLLTYAFPDIVTASMGSITQIGVPLGLAVYFLVARRDWVAGGVCLAWASTSAQDASIYIADAPYQLLPLIGGEHDWAFVLGPENFNILDRADTIAATVKGFGFAMFLTGVALCLVSPYLEMRKQAAADAAALVEPTQTGGWAVIPPWEEGQ